MVIVIVSCSRNANGSFKFIEIAWSLFFVVLQTLESREDEVKFIKKVNLHRMLLKSQLVD